MKKAVVLLSGGLDSATVLAFALRQGFLVHTISFDYGQRHAVEIACAHALVAAHGVRDHRLVNIDLRAFGGSALTSAVEVPKHRDLSQSSTEIPITYVPARNTIFLSFALAFAEVTGSGSIFIGVNAVDYSGYPDCRPQYIEAFSKMANLATRSAVEGYPVTFHTPLIDLTKAQIIAMGLELGVDYALTNSCYDPAPSGAPCGACDSCLLRAKGFAELGRPDPRVLKFGLT